MKIEKKVKITVSDAVLDDCKDLWIWRNNKSSREMFINSESVSWRKHKEWFAEYLNNKNLKIFIGKTFDGQKIGMCRFYKDEKTNEIDVSIKLSENFKGNFFSKPFLRLSVEFYMKNNKKILNATIKKDNIASIKCFISCGFKFIKEDEKYNYYQFNART